MDKAYLSAIGEAANANFYREMKKEEMVRVVRAVSTLWSNIISVELVSVRSCILIKMMM